MDKEEQQLIDEIKRLYLSYQLKECIAKVTEVDQNRTFMCHQTLQMYKGLSFFEASWFEKGYQCIDQIIEESEKRKEGSVEEIDVITWSLYQIQVYYIDLSKSESRNAKFLKICEDFQKQNQLKDNYNKGVYLFGKGIYEFIETVRLEDKLECIKYLEEACDLLDEYKQDIISFLSWIYFTKGKNDLAVERCEKLYSLNPSYPGCANNLAIFINNQGDFERSKRLYEQAEKYCPFNSVVLHNIAYSYSKMGDTQNEGLYYKKSYDLQPRQTQSCHRYGRYMKKQDNSTEAIKLFKEGIVIDPTYIGNYQELASTEEVDTITALRYLQKCVEINPDEGYNHYLLADRYERINKFTEAIDGYKTCIEKRNQYTIKISANSRIAYCYYRKNLINDSLQQYFITCNQRSSYYDFSSDFDNICNLINRKKGISLEKKIYLINQQEGYSLEKFQAISRDISDKNLKDLFLYRLDTLRAILSHIAYMKYVQNSLTYQNQCSHIDLLFN